MPAAKRKAGPKTRKRPRGSQREFNLTTTRALHNLFTRVEKLEKKDKRRLIGFGANAEGIETHAPESLDEVAEQDFIGGTRRAGEARRVDGQAREGSG